MLKKILERRAITINSPFLSNTLYDFLNNSFLNFLDKRSTLKIDVATSNESFVFSILSNNSYFTSSFFSGQYHELC